MHTAHMVGSTLLCVETKLLWQWLKPLCDAHNKTMLRRLYSPTTISGLRF